MLLPELGNAWRHWKIFPTFIYGWKWGEHLRLSKD
jgi:hypothetical protein